MLWVMRAHGVLPCCLLLAACIVPATAVAATAPPVEVAHDGATSLRARDEGKRLCLTFDLGTGFGESCLEDGAVAAATIPPAVGSATAAKVVGAVVPAGAARIEVRRAGVLLVAAPTVAGAAYRGRQAGRVRFALVRLAASAKTDGLRVRALDATGAPIAVVAPAFSDDLVTDRHVLLSGRVRGGGRWTVTTNQRSTLASSVADLDRENVEQCLDVAARSATQHMSSEGLCASPHGVGLLLQQLIGDTQSASLCDARFRLLYGQVPGTLTRVTALLGNGRRVRARLRAFPAAAETVYAIVVPAGLSVRSVTETRRSGGSRTRRVGLAPLSVGCATGTVDQLTPDFVASGTPELTPAGAVTEVAGTPGFRVADGPEGTLCLALAGHPFIELSCGLVAPGFANGVAALDSFEHPRAVVVALPADVAAVRLRAKGRPTRMLPTSDAPGYAGVYAGRVRFFAYALAAGESPEGSADYLDAAGAVLHTNEDSGGIAPTLGAPHRVAGRPGHPSLWRATVTPASATDRPCLALTAGPPPSAATACLDSYEPPLSVLLASSCATHRLTVAVAARSGSRITVRDTRGPAVPVPVRHGAGLLTLPAGRGALVVTARRKGVRTRRVLLRAPAGAAQCGWATTASGSDGGNGVSFAETLR